MLTCNTSANTLIIDFQQIDHCPHRAGQVARPLGALAATILSGRVSLSQNRNTGCCLMFVTEFLLITNERDVISWHVHIMTRKSPGPNYLTDYLNSESILFSPNLPLHFSIALDSSFPQLASWCRQLAERQK